MKRFLIRVFGFGLFCLLLIVGVCVGLDPYSVFHPDSIRDNGVEADKNYIKMRYILKNPERFDSFIFGSSRVGAIFPEKMEKLSCYNMTYSMGLPKDHLANLTTLTEKGIRPKKVFIGVDSLSYTMDPAIHKDFLYQYSYEMARDDALHFWLPFFDPSMAMDSLNTSFSYVPKNKDFRSDFYTFGCWRTGYKKPKNLDYLKEGAFIGTDDFREDVLSDIASIKALCEKNGIELVVFTNPMHHLTFDASVEQYWYTFVSDLARTTDFYNFAGLNKITSDDYNYNDTSHYIAQVGDLMIDRMENEADTQSKYGESFGFYTNAGNVEELISIWEEERAR